MKILNQRRTACTRRQAGLVGRNGNSLLGGKRCDPIVRNLMGFAAICLWLGIGKGNLSVLGYGRRLLRRFYSDIRPYQIGGRHLTDGFRGRLGRCGLLGPDDIRAGWCRDGWEEIGRALYRDRVWKWENV